MPPAAVTLLQAQRRDTHYRRHFSSGFVAKYGALFEARQDSAEHFCAMLTPHCTAVDWILITA